ncbi:MAG: hypothetical protein JNM89_03655 [Hyphomicrobiaceae bacterium]|nr:hypothetical protein [Hyphomicrobiaceae bacterium]
MSSRQLKFGFATICVIVGSVAFNLLAMQPSSLRGARPEHAYRGLDILPGATPSSFAGSATTVRQNVPVAAGSARTGSSRGTTTTDEFKRSVQDELAARSGYGGDTDGIASLMSRSASD